MDLYLQRYRNNSDFWDLDDFVYFCGQGFAKLIEAEYEAERQRMRQEKEEGYVSFSREWMTEIDVPIQKDERGYYSELPLRVMSFRYDIWSSGIQGIEGIGKQECGDFIRMSEDIAWHLCYIPTNQKRFWRLKNKTTIRYENIEACVPRFATLSLIPSADNEEYEIPDTREMDVIGMAFNLMAAGRQGRPVIKKVNDENPNAVMEAEADIKPVG